MTVLQQNGIWISEAEVVSMMDIGEAIAALEKGLLAEAQGDARNMVKTHVEWGDGDTLHAIGAIFPKAGFAGTKTWAHTHGGATPLLVLYDSNSGALKAIIEAFALGQLRTGAVSGVATKWLAASDAGNFAIIGTGKQAMTQVAAVLAVRAVQQVRVFSRNEEHRNQFAKRVQKEFGIEAVPANNIHEAVKDAGIVTLVTRATEPLLTASMLARGSHVNAVGAIVPSRAEVTSDVVARATQIVVDTLPQAQRLSRELLEFFGPDPAHWKSVRSLAQVVATQRPRAAAADDLTLFKSLGMGIADLSLGIELYHKAVQSGLGRSFAHPQKVPPRLRTKVPVTSFAGG